MVAARHERTWLQAVTAGWVAAGVRSQALTRRCIGRSGATEVAGCGSLGAALGVLHSTAYRHDLRPAEGLDGAQRSVAATLLWHLRVLAGWCPPTGGVRLVAVAAGLELVNIVDHARMLAGERVSGDPFVLGALATAWPEVAAAGTPVGLRRALAASAWGDPGVTQPDALALELGLRWALRLRGDVPEAQAWAGRLVALLLARVDAAGGRSALHDRTVAQAAWVARAMPPGGAGWHDEVRLVDALDGDARRLLAGAVRAPGAVVGAAGLLAVDAWLTRAALGVAALGGGRLDEVLGAAR